MSIIAINDNIFLVLHADAWYGRNKNKDYLVSICAERIFLITTIGTFGAYEIVLMTLDKVIAIRLPHKAQSMCTAKRAHIVSLAAFILCCVLSLPQLFFSSVITGTKQCARYVQEGWYVTAYMHLFMVIYPLIPVVLLLWSNFAIIKVLWQRRKLNIGKKTSRTNSSEAQITVMLILVSMMFLVLLLPFEIRTFYYFIAGRPTTAQAFATYMLAFTLTRDLHTINYCINFFLYLISGKKFRRDFKALFCQTCSEENVSRSRNVSGSAAGSSKVSGDSVQEGNSSELTKY